MDVLLTGESFDFLFLLGHKTTWVIHVKKCIKSEIFVLTVTTT